MDRHSRGRCRHAGRSLRQGSRRRPDGSRHARLRGLSGLPAPLALRVENAAQAPLLTRYGGRAGAASGHCGQRAGPAPEPVHDQSAADAVGGTASAPARPSSPVVPRAHSSARTRYAAVIWSMRPAARSGHPTGRPAGVRHALQPARAADWRCTGQGPAPRSPRGSDRAGPPMRALTASCCESLRVPTGCRRPEPNPARNLVAGKSRCAVGPTRPARPCSQCDVQGCLTTHNRRHRSVGFSAHHRHPARPRCRRILVGVLGGGGASVHVQACACKARRGGGCCLSRMRAPAPPPLPLPYSAGAPHVTV